MSTSADPASAVVAALAGAGTRLVFGVPGGGPNLDVVGAAAAAGLRFVLARGETAATIMAATYADLTGTPGAVVVTRGPGLASAVNGIAHAALDRLPVVVIADTGPVCHPPDQPPADRPGRPRPVRSQGRAHGRRPPRRGGRRTPSAQPWPSPGDPSSPTWTRAPPTSTHWSPPEIPVPGGAASGGRALEC